MALINLKYNIYAARRCGEQNSERMGVIGKSQRPRAGLEGNLLT